jgi:hypothetical protein
LGIHEPSISKLSLILVAADGRRFLHHCRIGEIDSSALIYRIRLARALTRPGDASAEAENYAEFSANSVFAVQDARRLGNELIGRRFLVTNTIRKRIMTISGYILSVTLIIRATSASAARRRLNMKSSISRDPEVSRKAMSIHPTAF